jgi:hypothetical protein
MDQGVIVDVWPISSPVCRLLPWPGLLEASQGGPVCETPTRQIADLVLCPYKEPLSLRASSTPSRGGTR